jgi:hypothetical protein
MAVIQDASYKPSFIFKNGHINTIFPFLLRDVPKIEFKRKRVHTPDDDFLDIDLIEKNSKKVIILCHGLEGSSNSQYIQACSSLLDKENYNILAINYRSCSGEMNNRPTLYHSGYIDDLEWIIDTSCSQYEEIILVGYSLGGNIILKYLATSNHVSSKISLGIAISTPADLKHSSKRLLSFDNKLYQKKFLETLRPKMIEKALQFPGIIDVKNLKKVKNTEDFDEFYTAPLHGFDGAQDYYKKANSLQDLANIKTPTVMISAMDDPFLSKEAFPTEIAKNHSYLDLIMTKYGGHVGFSNPLSTYYWIEKKVLSLIKEITSK